LDQRKLGIKIKDVLGRGFRKFGLDEEKNVINKKRIFKQVKILTEKDKTGGTASKGMAFVEFTNPEHAEVFLKSVDDLKVAKSFAENRTPIIEFAFEDIRKLKQIEKMKEQ
jgi:hypothetical protein